MPSVDNIILSPHKKRNQAYYLSINAGFERKWGSVIIRKIIKQVYYLPGGIREQ